MILSASRPRALPLVALTALAGLASGCVFWAPSLDPLRHELEASVPRSHVDAGIQLRLGRISLAMARSIARAAAEDEEERQVADLLRHVKGVEVAVYELDDVEPHNLARWSQEVARIGERRGWQVAARFQDEGEAGSVLYQVRGGEIRSVYLFALDEESLVLARFKGHLDRAIADAIAMQGRELPEALAAEAGGGR